MVGNLVSCVYKIQRPNTTSQSRSQESNRTKKKDPHVRKNFVGTSSPRPTFFFAHDQFN